MSGGSFDYKQYEIGYIADQIEQELHIQGKLKPKSELFFSEEFYAEFQDKKYYHTYPEAVQDEMRNAVDILRKALIYAHRIDYLLAGDDSEESFLKRLKEDLNKL